MIKSLEIANSKIGRNTELHPRQVFENFFELDSAAEDRLKQRVAQNQGKVRLVIHPYFETKLYAQAKLVERGLERMVARNSARQTPVFIFEQQASITETQAKLTQAVKASGNKQQAAPEVYFVPTYAGKPEPKLDPNQDEETEYNEREESQHWAELIERFKALGVKQIMIGGMYLLTNDYREHPHFSDEAGRSFLGCVNTVIGRLSPDFEMEVSHLAFPASRRDTGPKFVEDFGLE